ncbi:MAG: alginate export family protein [Pirellula sp.]
MLSRILLLLQLGDRSMLSFGGNYWVRYMNENNSRLTQTTNSYTLDRLRTYAGWYYRDNVRWITFWTQYHRFWLDQPKNALYGPGGNVLRRDATGGSGIDVGDELGLFANFHMTRYSDIMVSYNKLYGDDFLKSSAGPNQSSDADSLYLMFQQRW